jgi:DNA-binding winged helix-turn-helix (wHTH) protein
MRGKDESFVIDRERGRALHEGREVRLGRKTFAVLSYLMEHQDRIVSKEELRSGIPDVELSNDAILTTMMTKLQRALGHEQDASGPIETVRGHGYRFRAPRRAPGACEVLDALRMPDPQPRREPFVGRDSALSAMRARFTNGQRGAENLILLVGDAGIGRTRVARELCGVARDDGLRALFAPVHDEESAPPYGPWIQILRAAHEELGIRAFQRCLPGIAWPLGQLVPELCAATVPSMEPQAARFCLFEALGGFLKKVSTERPLLIVLDDLQCADEGTIELLRYVAGALQEQRVTFLATLRTGESAEPWHTHARLGRLASVASVIELAGLSVDAVAELTAAYAGTPCPELALALHDRARGNPLFVCQSLDLMRQQGRWSFDAGSAVGADMAPALRRIILRRLRGLPAPSQAAIAAAAVIGRSFDSGLLAAVLSMGVREVFELLEPALHMGVLEPDPTPASGLSFRHALVRDGVYGELSPRERGAMHGRVARALDQRRAGDARNLAARAHHWLHTLPVDQNATVAACRSAAAAARAASSFESSTQLLGAALAQVEQLGCDIELRFGLLLELGEDHFYAGHSASAWAAFYSAAECAGGSARSDLLAQVAPRLLDCVEFGVGDQRFARSVVEQALASSTARAERVEACLLVYRSILASELPAPEAQALAERAASLAERSTSLEAKLEVAHVRAMTRDPRRLTECIVAAQHFLKLVDRHPAVAARMRYRALRGFGAHLTRYVCALTTCDLAAADLYLEQCRQIAESSHNRLVQSAVGLVRAGRALGERRLVELRELITRHSPQIVGAVEREAWRAYEYALLEAQGHASLESLEGDATLLESLSGSKFAVQAAIVRARNLAVNGDLGGARALLALVPREWIDSAPVQSGDLGALCALAEVQLLLGDQAALEKLYERLAPFATCNAVGPHFDSRGAVAHFLGRLARRTRDPETARNHFRQAVAINRKLNMPAQLACSEHHLQHARV